MMPTMRIRAATRGSSRNAGRCAARAIPPNPSRTPRYGRDALGELRMKPRLALVRATEAPQHDVERAHQDPAIGGRLSRHGGYCEQQKAVVLRDPCAGSHDPALPLCPGRPPG